MRIPHKIGGIELITTWDRVESYRKVFLPLINGSFVVCLEYSIKNMKQHVVNIFSRRFSFIKQTRLEFEEKQMGFKMGSSTF